LTLAVKCRIGNTEGQDIALLDTGAEWSVIDWETAETVGDELGPPTEEIRLSTRLGDYSGSLCRVKITLLAEEGCGCDLCVDGTVFVSEQWEGPVVLGYRGFLEKVRIAFDPGSAPNQETFFFGPVGGYDASADLDLPR